MRDLSKVKVYFDTSSGTAENTTNLAAATAAGTAIWQSALGVTGGNWNDASHWVGGILGSSSLDVSIGPGLAILFPFVINANGGSALDLTMTMGQGTLDVTGGGSLAVTNSLFVGSGLLLDDGGVISTGTAVIGNEAGSLRSGTAMFVDGGTWNVTSLEISPTANGVAIVQNGSLGTGGTINATTLTLGATTNVLGGGTLTVDGGGRVNAGTLNILGGSTISLDGSGAVMVGAAAAVGGAIDVAAGATLNGSAGHILGNLIDNGVVISNSPNVAIILDGLQVSGSLTGTGVVDVATTLTLASAATFTGTIAVARNGLLVLNNGALNLARLNLANAALDLVGLAYNPAAVPVYNGTSGILTIGGDTLNVGTGLVITDFATGQDNGNGTLITENPADAWIGTNPSGNWVSAAHWSSAHAPNATDAVVIGDGINATSPWTTTLNSAGQTALELTLTNSFGTLNDTGGLTVGDMLLNLAGTVIVGANGTLNANSVQHVGGKLILDGGVMTDASVIVEAPAMVEDSGVWTTSSMTLFSGGTVTLQQGPRGTGGVLNVLGTLSLGRQGALAANPGIVSVTGHSTINAGAITMFSGSTVTVGAAGEVVVGTATAAAGAVVVGSSGTLTAAAADSITGYLIDNGTVTVSRDALLLPGGTAGSLAVSNALSGSGHLILSQATVTVLSAAGFTGTVELGTNDELIIRAGGMANGLVQFVGTLGEVDLRGQVFNAAAQKPVYNATTGRLVVGGATLDVGTGFVVGDFATRADTFGGTLVVDPPCYAAGTRILAEHGEVAVEALRPGDRVRTAGGRLAPVKWVGQTRVDLRRHPDPRRAAPIRIAAGAFAAGVPRRDLLVSPDHAIAVGDALVPARALANGASIRGDLGLDRITYVHVELDRHDLLLAEGLAAESFLDTGNRGMFDAEMGVRPLFPDFNSSEAESLRIFAERGWGELHVSGPVVAAEHARLLARARALGHALTEDGGLMVAADCDAPITVRDGAHCLSLPSGRHRIWLRSRDFSPAECDPGCGDGRRLGVVLVVALDGAPLDAAAFARGWHEAEGDGAWRWTDGDAELALPALDAPAELTLRVLPAGARYWMAMSAAQLAAVA